jgi:hypothetical protein
MKFDHIEVSVIENQGPPPTSTSIDYTKYFDLVDWGCIGRRTEMDEPVGSAEYMVATSSETMGVLSITFELSEVDVHHVPVEAREPYYILYKQDDDVKQVKSWFVFATTRMLLL